MRVEIGPASSRRAENPEQQNVHVRRTWPDQPAWMLSAKIYDVTIKAIGNTLNTQEQYRAINYKS
jgi:hypothetical protein